MGIFNILGKIVYGAADFAAEAMDYTAKGIDRMSDEEIERRHLKPAKMIRRDAAEMSDEELERKYSIEANEVRKDAAKMSKEELERKYSVSASKMRMKADTMKEQSTMWKMETEERKMREKILRMEEERLREQNKNCKISGYNKNDEYDDDFVE